MIARIPHQDPVPLLFLRTNERGRVVDLMGDCSCLHRLKEMGLQIGSVVTMLVPGRPCVLGIDGRRLSIRVDCEADILVEPLQDHAESDHGASHRAHARVGG